MFRVPCTWVTVRIPRLYATCLKSVHNVSQTGSPCNLGKHHNNELAPAVQGRVLSLRPEVISFNLSKVISVNKMKQLMKSCVRMRYTWNFLSFNWVTGNLTISRKARFRPILFS